MLLRDNPWLTGSTGCICGLRSRRKNGSNTGPSSHTAALTFLQLTAKPTQVRGEFALFLRNRFKFRLLNPSQSCGRRPLRQIATRSRFEHLEAQSVLSGSWRSQSPPTYASRQYSFKCAANGGSSRFQPHIVMCRYFHPLVQHRLSSKPGYSTPLRGTFAVVSRILHLAISWLEPKPLHT